MSGDVPARILIADDHQELLDRVVKALGLHFTVVGAVKDGAQLLAAEATLRPDVLVIDISMPVLTGLEALSRIRARGSQVPAVCLTASSDDDMRQAAFEAGALGFVRKGALAADLVAAVRAALAGERFASA